MSIDHRRGSIRCARRDRYATHRDPAAATACPWCRSATGQPGRATATVSPSLLHKRLLPPPPREEPDADQVSSTSSAGAAPHTRWLVPLAFVIAVIILAVIIMT